MHALTACRHDFSAHNICARNYGMQTCVQCSPCTRCSRSFSVLLKYATTPPPTQTSSPTLCHVTGPCTFLLRPDSLRPQPGAAFGCACMAVKAACRGAGPPSRMANAGAGRVHPWALPTKYEAPAGKRCRAQTFKELCTRVWPSVNGFALRMDAATAVLTDNSMPPLGVD